MRRLLALLVTAGIGFSAAAHAQTALPYPDINDPAHATKDVNDFFRVFFVAKSLHKPDDMMVHFARDKVLYIDATSGGIWPTWDSLNKVFHLFPAKPATALSYPWAIYGDRKSALVAFADTPELFGRELRILGAVSFDNDGKIVRWMDYWDGRSSNVKNVLKPTYPTAFADDVGNATGKIAQVSKTLHDALANGDAAAAAALFTPDAVYEDMALHAQILGKLAIGRYLNRATLKVPYAKGSSMVHVVGGDMGGGYEWTPAGTFPMKRGITSIALDAQGLISHFTTVYDSSLIDDASYQAMVMLSAEQPLP
jgi:ketosteroid isomerase-like protein